MKITYKCKFCDKVCKSNSLKNHERRCPFNSDRINPSYNHKSWNKGLTKETDERIAKGAKTLLESYKSGKTVSPNKGKHHTEEERKHLSEMRKKYLQEHPDQVPYVLNHHSKGDSYPEKYFKEIFDNKNIQYEQNYKMCGYFLDFAWPKLKIYIEIDGEQHYLDKRIILHDKKRTENLSNAGWRLLKRIRWSDWQKLKPEEKENEIYRLLQTLKIQNSF